MSAPPFKIRDQSTIDETLGDFGLPNGYSQIPIYNYQNSPLVDDLDMPSCDYANKVDAYRFPAESTYTNVEYLKADLREPFTKFFNLNKKQSEDMSFMDLYGYCD